jgi:hypothetical protein
MAVSRAKWQLWQHALGISLCATLLLSPVHAEQPFTKDQIFNLIADAHHQYDGLGEWPEFIPPRWVDHPRIALMVQDKTNTSARDLDAHLSDLASQINDRVTNVPFPTIQTKSVLDEANVLVFVGQDLEIALQSALRRPAKGWKRLVDGVRMMPTATCTDVLGETVDREILAGLVFVSTTVPLENQKRCISSALLHIVGLQGTSEIDLSLKNCMSDCALPRTLDIEALQIIYARPGSAALSKKLDDFFQSSQPKD